MPKFNVEHNGKWACFSSIVDTFITEFMPLEEYEKWRDLEYGRQKTCLNRANKMDIEETVLHMMANKSDNPHEVLKGALCENEIIRLVEKAIASLKRDGCWEEDDER